MVVAFEGLNGVGKTSLACAIADALGVSYHSTPPIEASEERNLFAARPFSDAALLYYLAWVKRFDEEAQLRYWGKVVICDRYVGSTLAYFGASGNDASRLLRHLEITSPALTILVTVDESIRSARLRERAQPLRVIDRATLSTEFRTAVLASYRSASPLIEIDTSHRSIARLVGGLVERISCKLGAPR